MIDRITNGHVIVHEAAKHTAAATAQNGIDIVVGIIIIIGVPLLLFGLMGGFQRGLDEVADGDIFQGE